MKDKYRLIKDLSNHEYDELDVDFNLEVKQPWAYAVAVLSVQEFNEMRHKRIITPLNANLTKENASP